MHDYEILILDQNRHPSTYVEVIEASDAAAIRSAVHIAHGRDVEVWRDLNCVYRTQAGMAPHSAGI